MSVSIGLTIDVAPELGFHDYLSLYSPTEQLSSSISRFLRLESEQLGNLQPEFA
jgi:hypothetical protein